MNCSCPQYDKIKQKKNQTLLYYASNEHFSSNDHWIHTHTHTKEKIGSVQNHWFVFESQTFIALIWMYSVNVVTCDSSILAYNSRIQAGKKNAVQ